MNNDENVIEWLKGAKTAMITVTQVRYKNKIKKYAASKPKECVVLAENTDGSICARIPLSWLKISPPRSVSSENVEKATERINNYNQKYLFNRQNQV